MSLFNYDIDVYTYNYTYEQMKIACLIGSMSDTYDLDYEDIMYIVDAIDTMWNWNECKKENTNKYPWLKLESREEKGYIQAYAQRILPRLIKLYKETTK